MQYDTTYFSKNTFLWKKLNNKNFHSYLNFIKFENRILVKKIGKIILFCLPPSIGLGDAVEYALSINAVLKSGSYEKLGIAFVGKYKEIFQKYFKINNIYEEVISKEDMLSFDTIFHVTSEIKALKYQKYDRKNIEHLITSFFCVPKYRTIDYNIKNINNKLNKITIFPISNSPLRTMSVDILNNLIDYFYRKIEIEIIFNRDSNISNYVENNINSNKVNILHPKNLSELLIIIENMYFGVFMDSGPLHVAKILNKKGVLIVSTVGPDILLSGFESIRSVDNNYKSIFCHSPCGLVNVFNFNNNTGCYDSLKIKKNRLLELKNLHTLQRGSLKKNYINLMAKPVNCLKEIKKKEIIKQIQQYLFN